MAYLMNHGVDKDGMDNTQRGLLIGLPAIALALSFGAAHHSVNSPAKVNAKTIPVVSSLKTGGRSNNTGGGGTGGTDAAGASQAGSTGSSAAGSSVSGAAGTGSGTGGTTTSGSGFIGSGGSGGGGSGGGSGGTGGTTGGLGGGGGTTLPDCSIGQIATVNCQVPACTPTAVLSPGQKAVLSINGTCVILN